MAQNAPVLVAKKEPAEIHAFAANRPRSIGELVAFANSLPPAYVAPVALSLTRVISANSQDNGSEKYRLRQLVILGALMNRLIFEIEAVPEVITHLI